VKTLPTTDWTRLPREIPAVNRLELRLGEDKTAYVPGQVLYSSLAVSSELQTRCSNLDFGPLYVNEAMMRRSRM
jgi:hypothetical protein